MQSYESQRIPLPRGTIPYMTAVTRTAEDDALETVAAGAADDPFAVLGPHSTTHNGRPAIVIRTMQPSATSVEVLIGDQALPMTRRHRDGLFEAVVGTEARSPNHLFSRVPIPQGRRGRETMRPYRFGPVLTVFGLH